MIEKVAISQCLRESYPKDFEGLYTAEELAPAEYSVVVDQNGEVISEGDDDKKEEVITQGERQAMFSAAHKAFGKEKGNAVIKKLIDAEGLQSTSQMTKSVYERIFAALEDEILREGEEIKPEDDE